MWCADWVEGKCGEIGEAFGTVGGDWDRIDVVWWGGCGVAFLAMVFVSGDVANDDGIA